METPHENEEREAEELRREERQRQIDKVVPLPPRATSRTTDEIIAEARIECSVMGDEEATVTCMLGYLAKQIEILERELDAMRQLNVDLARQVLDG